MKNKSPNTQSQALAFATTLALCAVREFATPCGALAKQLNHSPEMCLAQDNNEHTSAARRRYGLSFSLMIADS
jgi:hypothetical protein